MCPARATRLTKKILEIALRNNTLLFMDGGQTLDPVQEGYKIIDERNSNFLFFCSPTNDKRAVSPDGKYLFIPTETTQKEKK